MANDEVHAGRRRFLTATTAVVGAVGVAAAAVPFVTSWKPSARAQVAGAPVNVELEIDPAELPRVYSNARVMLVPNTPLKDMQVELSPGGAPADPLPDGGTLPIGGSKQRALLSLLVLHRNRPVEASRLVFGQSLIRCRAVIANECAMVAVRGNGDACPGRLGYEAWDRHRRSPVPRPRCRYEAMCRSALCVPLRGNATLGPGVRRDDATSRPSPRSPSRSSRTSHSPRE